MMASRLVLGMIFWKRGINNITICSLSGGSYLFAWHHQQKHELYYVSNASSILKGLACSSLAYGLKKAIV